MSLLAGPALQDTTVVEVARDGLALVSAWTMIGMALAFVAILVVLVLVLAELRGLSRAWTGFLTAADDRSRPMLEHAGNAARNLDHVTTVVRTEVDRLNETVGNVADDLGQVSVEARRRLADVSALLDLAQSEAEEAVLDVAAKVRMLRRGAGLLERMRARGGGGGGRGDSGGTVAGMDGVGTGATVEGRGEDAAEVDAGDKVPAAGRDRE